MQKHVNLVDLVKSFPTNIYLQNLVSIQKRTSPVKFAHVAEKSGKGSISNLSTKVARLNEEKDAAVAEKERVEAEAAAGEAKLALANRLVNGLADEYVRWQGTVKDLKIKGTSFIGDCLLASAFVGYISPFNANFRNSLTVQWLEDIKQRQIPFTEGIDPLKVLTDEASIAQWMNEGLPADRISVENACVVTACAR